MPPTLESRMETAIMRHPSQGSSGERYPQEHFREVAAEGATARKRSGTGTARSDGLWRAALIRSPPKGCEEATLFPPISQV